MNVAFRTISEIWHHFDTIEGSNSSLKTTICKYYQQDYACALKTYDTNNF